MLFRSDTATTPGAAPPTSQATGVLPSTEGRSQAQKYDLNAGYGTAYGDAQAKPTWRRASR